MDILSQASCTLYDMTDTHFAEPVVPSHEFFMGHALREAQKAFDAQEVPVGAVIVKEGRIVGRGYNRIEALNDATAHAEIVAIGAASEAIGDWRLNGCTLYVTVEPCVMCLGAIMQSRIDSIVFGTSDNVFGAIETTSHRDRIENAYKRFPEIVSGVMREEARNMMQSFFRELRKKAKQAQELSLEQNTDTDETTIDS